MKEAERFIEVMQREFPLEAGLIHLNHAAVGPWPRRAAEAVRRFAEENLHRGSLHYGAWLETEARLRRRLAALIGEEAGDIALLKNTSEGLSVIAHGLSWRTGDQVVIPAGEFPSNRIVWESLAPQGVRVIRVPLPLDEEAPEERLLAACTPRTRLLSVSAVDYATGLRLDLERLGRECRIRGILFVVDAIQWLGALPFDNRRIGADAVVADGHKWMLGPEGLALFWCRRELRERLTLHQFGWHMVEAPGDFDREEWRPASSARRFECGSPNMVAIHALEASLSLFGELGMEAVAKAVAANVDHLVARILDHPRLEILSPEDPARRAGIVTFRHRRVSSEHIYRRLMEERILCALRGGGIRFSPHCHNTPRQIDRALQRIDAIS